MMSFDKVVLALQFMGVSLAEFESFLNNYSPNEADALLEEIERANISQNITKLRELQVLSEENGFPFISLAAKSSRVALNEEETEKIVVLLYDTEIWGYKELAVCLLTMDNFSIRDILSILEIILIDQQILFNSSQYRGYIVEVCCRAATIFSTRGYKEYAEYVLNRVVDYKLVNTMFHRNLWNVTKGYWLYCFVDTIKGDEMMLKAIQTFKELANPETATYYQLRYDLFVKKQNNDYPSIFE